MKLVGLVLLGLIASFVVWIPVNILLAVMLPADMGEGWGLLLVVIAGVPISFFLGSMVTGYFSYYPIEDKWGLILMAPALYTNIIFFFVSMVQISLDSFIGVNAGEGRRFLLDLWKFALIGFLLYAASLGGVVLGYYLRGRIVRWWYGD